MLVQEYMFLVILVTLSSLDKKTVIECKRSCKLQECWGYSSVYLFFLFPFYFLCVGGNNFEALKASFISWCWFRDNFFQQLFNIFDSACYNNLWIRFVFVLMLLFNIFCTFLVLFLVRERRWSCSSAN